LDARTASGASVEGTAQDQGPCSSREIFEEPSSGGMRSAARRLLTEISNAGNICGSTMQDYQRSSPSTPIPTYALCADTHVGSTAIPSTISSRGSTSLRRLGLESPNVAVHVAVALRQILRRPNDLEAYQLTRLISQYSLSIPHRAPQSPPSRLARLLLQTLEHSFSRVASLPRDRPHLHESSGERALVLQASPDHDISIDLAPALASLSLAHCTTATRSPTHSPPGGYSPPPHHLACRVCQYRNYCDTDNHDKCAAP
jgi:hypothetical protein